MDYYSILGVNRNASSDEIRKAYKKKSMQHHPDRGGDEEEFKRVNEAYQILSNSDKRSAYDNPGPDFSFTSRDFQNGNNPFAGTPFENMFRNGFGPSRTPRNRDVTVATRISLADVLTGKQAVIQYSTGTGRIETITVDIPAGARHGDTIKYQGLGDDADRRFPRGDLLVRIQIPKEKNWDRENDNLITKIYTNIFDFLLGGVIILETLDKRRLEIKLPKGSNIGTTFSLPGYGIPNLQTGKRGNIYVKVEAKIPNINDTSILNKIEALKNEIKDL